MAIAGPAAQAQVLIEGFDTDGDGISYTVIGGGVGSSTSLWQLNTLGSLLPINAAGDRISIFFNDNSDATQYTADTIAVYDATVNFAAPGGTSAVFIVNGPPDDESTDSFLVDRLTSALGFTSVIVVDDDATPGVDYSLAGVDLIVVSDDISSNDVQGKFENVTIPIINYEPAAHDNFGISNDGGTQLVSMLNVVDAAHPIAVTAGLGAGNFAFATTAVDTHDNGLDLAPGAVVVIEQLDGKPALVVVPSGAELRRVLPDPFDGEVGAAYFLGANLDEAFGGGPPRSVILNPVDTTLPGQSQLLVALAATSGFEIDQDFLNILVDPENDGTFDLLANAFGAGDMILNGVPLGTTFQDFTFNLPASPNLVIRFDAFTSSGGEQVGIDNVRLIPEPGTFGMMVLLLLGGFAVARRHRARS